MSSLSLYVYFVCLSACLAIWLSVYLYMPLSDCPLISLILGHRDEQIKKEPFSSKDITLGKADVMVNQWIFYLQALYEYTVNYDESAEVK